jgi:hypothetical protein
MLQQSAGMLAILFGAASMTVAVAQTTQPKTQTTPQGQMQLTQSECESLWNQVDSSGTGALTQSQAQPYVTNFGSVDGNSDGRLSRAEFMQGCDRGQIQRTATTGAGGGTAGSGGASSGSATTGGDASGQQKK